MTDYIEISGQTVSGLVVSAGTVLDVGSGGTVIDALVQDGGQLVVSSGGVTTSAVLDAGGTQQVADDGSANETTVKNGGYLVVSSGGSITSAYDSAGTLIVSGGGSQFYTRVSGTVTVDITQLVGSGEISSGLVIGGPGLVDTLDIVSGGVAVSTTIVAGGVAYAFSGGTAAYTNVSNAGNLLVSAGGTAAYTNVSLGGKVVISPGGSATSTAVGFEGQLIVSGGGSATNTMVSPGAAVSVSQDVAAGQVSSGVVVGPYSSLDIELGGVTTGTMILSGGYELVSSGGTEFGTIIGAGGNETVSGTSIDTDVGGELDLWQQGALLSNATITGSGVVDQLVGGHVSNVTITDSGSLTLQFGDVASGAIAFSGDGSLVIQDSTAPTAVLSGFGSGNTIDYQGLAYFDSATATVEGQTLVLTAGYYGQETRVLQLAGNYAGATFTLAPDGNPSSSNDYAGGTLITVTNMPCFAAGTLIATDHGPVAVEHLAVGDRVLTIEGVAEPILWIGSRAIDCRRHPNPNLIMPVRIRAHTFAPGEPAQDLFLSPDHAIFAEGVLIPVKHLVNGSTIAQLTVDAVTYYHVELSHHAVMLAEGLPVESYRDTGDRSAFANADGVTQLHPAFGSAAADTALVADALAYAPLRVTGPEVERVRILVHNPLRQRPSAEPAPRLA